MKKRERVNLQLSVVLLAQASESHGCELKSLLLHMLTGQVTNLP